MSVIDSKPTLVMGARGSVGRLVLESLQAVGVPVRASSRMPKPGQFPEGLDVFAADLTAPASLEVAFRGVSRVFLYANHDGVHGVIHAARAAGIDTVVLMSSGSVLHPTSTGNAITEEHRQVEAAFAEASDLRVVPIRPLVLATNALGWARPIRANHTLEIYKPDALMAPIHEQDIAAVAVTALTGTATAAVSDLVTGPERISQRDQVEAIATAIGRPITVAEMTYGQALEQLSRFMPGEEALAVLQFIDDAALGNSPSTTAVEAALGRAPLGFDIWAHDHVDDFQ